MAIQQYVMVALHRNFDNDLIVKYSEYERVPDASHVKHPLVREALGLLGEDGRGWEITSMADVPAGLGLGSSSAFTVALLAAFHAAHRQSPSQASIAKEACEVEIERAKAPIGRQDQYYSALGGCRLLSMVGGLVSCMPIELPESFTQRASLWASPIRRSASAVLATERQTATTEDYRQARSLVAYMLSAIDNRSISAMADCLNQQWLAKQARQEYPDSIQTLRESLSFEDYGMKLVGAGGGGCLLVLPRGSSSTDLKSLGLQRIPLQLDTEGVKVVLC